MSTEKSGALLKSMKLAGIVTALVVVGTATSSAEPLHVDNGTTARGGSECDYQPPWEHGDCDHGDWTPPGLPSTTTTTTSPTTATGSTTSNPSGTSPSESTTTTGTTTSGTGSSTGSTSSTSGSSTSPSEATGSTTPHSTTSVQGGGKPGGGGGHGAAEDVNAVSAQSADLANTGAHGWMTGLGGLLLVGGTAASVIARRRRA
ncbi:LPXTG cell wall anchor domain-containing protein [Umezawaea sp. Da 62-37]|uniref:LPXTG cell wall anchor domain-containing protein n=1 Tax=Umezawaea sp. Da 62-37 TaxID=3075927 RepID=UPI0028F71F63|nr:LPXTG cell wall anchor domain-containing protein [Umezawaea sp. Da 62-37]WNV83932.1 LPXTG cell wall anchor domain-containing protein [Umezawaea sp. Da 62-37]